MRDRQLPRKVLDDYIMIEEIGEYGDFYGEVSTPGGIVLGWGMGNIRQGYILAVGENCSDVAKSSVGMILLFPPQERTKCHWNHEDFLFVRETQALGVTDEPVFSRGA